MGHGCIVMKGFSDPWTTDFAAIKQKEKQHTLITESCDQ